MDTVKKDKHRFNFVDAIIILIVIAAIAVLAKIFFFKEESSTGQMVDIYYAVECAEVYPFMAYNMVPGEVFFDSEKGYRLGVGVDCVVGDSENLTQAADGHVVATNTPNARSVIIIISATAEKKEYEYSIDEYCTLQVGQEFRLSSPRIAGYGHCIALAEVNSEQDKADFVKKAKDMVYKADIHVDERVTEENTNE